MPTPILPRGKFVILCSCPRLIYLLVFQTVIYPAVLTTLGIVGNAVILGGQIKELRDDLRKEIGELRADVRKIIGELRADVRGVKADTLDLLRHQTDLERQDTARVQDLVMDSGKKK